MKTTCGALLIATVLAACSATTSPVSKEVASQRTPDVTASDVSAATPPNVTASDVSAATPPNVTASDVSAATPPGETATPTPTPVSACAARPAAAMALVSTPTAEAGTFDVSLELTNLGRPQGAYYEAVDGERGPDIARISGRERETDASRVEVLSLETNLMGSTITLRLLDEEPFTLGASVKGETGYEMPQPNGLCQTVWGFVMTTAPPIRLQ